VTPKKPPTDATRQVHTKVKSAKGRKISSTRWLQRQLNDPYVTRAKTEGYRSRAAFKLLELDDKFKFLKPGHHVVDLGAAPGGWTQVAVERVKAGQSRGGKVVGIDISEMDQITHATIMIQDFLSDDAPEKLKEALGGKANVVLSDMAAPSCGHQQTDHIRIMGLCEAAFDFASEILAPEGVFVAKILRGGTELQLLKSIKQHFTTVKHVKPAASRADSSEMYVVAIGFKPQEQHDA
jgi:23S rRNA (uridine2552-2'-O)-methyltransferase